MRTLVSVLVIAICAACSNQAQPIEDSTIPAASQVTLQCGKDTDCKGDRICDRGICTNPVTSEALPDTRMPTPEVGMGSRAADEAPEGPPQFKDYPADAAYTGPAAELDLSDDFASQYQTRLGEALMSDPVFAGEYVSATWGCGTSCSVTTFLNKRTGKTLEQGFGGEDGRYVTEFRIDSRLLVAEGFADGDYMDETREYNAYFYELQGNNLKLIRTIPTDRPDGDN